MNNDNVAAIRNAYAVAERKDLKGWISLFTPDGAFVDNSVGATYRGRTLADPVRNYGTAFSNMHRELYRIYVDGNVVVVQLALQGIPLACSLPRVSKWTPRAATCSNLKMARSIASTATRRVR
ncbi:MAG: nuclear transport factor 2 family protein [Pseudolabrys sp.]